MSRIEKILDLYLFILYVSLIILVILVFIAGPLVMGIIFSPYWFLGYIATVLMAPLLIALATSVPSAYRLLMED